MVRLYILGGFLSLILFASGCGPGGDPGVDWRPIIRGTATLSGPLPVTARGTGSGYARIGFYETVPLLTLLVPGSDEIRDNQPIWFVLEDPDAGGRRARDFEMRLAPLGTYDLALVNWKMGKAVIGRADSVTIDSPRTVVEGINVSFNTSGNGPYGSLGGKLYINGNPPERDEVQVLLAPKDEWDVDAHPRFAWPVTPVSDGYGRIDYTIPELQYGTYAVTYCGLELRDLGGLEKPVYTLAVNSSQPHAAGADFHIATSWQAERPFELGVISGTVRISGGLAPDDLSLVARRIPPWTAGDTPDYPDWSRYDEAYQSILPGDLDVEGRAEFTLGWLVDGEYEVAAYIFSNDGTPVQAAACGETLIISYSHRELDGIELEVSR